MICSVENGRNHRLLKFLTALLVLFSSARDVVARPDGNGLNKNGPVKTESFETKSKLASSTASPSRVSSQASSSLRRIRQEYNDAVKMGIAYDWVLQKRIIPKKKKRKNDPAYDMSSNYICLGPLTTNMRHWHFSFRGAGEVFGKGIYHGRIVLPKDYPLKPPRVQMWTESGRFKPGADICLSASAYHPESWTPKWTIFGLVNALRLHMLQSPIEIGGIARTREDMLDFAQKSQSWFIEWWSGGSVKIQVSHAKLLKEGILTLDHDGEEELQKQVTDELQSLVNQKNETTISQGIGTEFFAEPGTNGGDVPAVAIRKEHTSSASTAVFVDNAKKKKNSGIKKKKMKHRRVGTVPADRLLQQVEQRKLGKRQVQNHVRLMRLTQSLTDPVTVAFISILILIWLNK